MSVLSVSALCTVLLGSSASQELLWKVLVLEQLEQQRSVHSNFIMFSTLSSSAIRRHRKYIVLRLIWLKRLPSRSNGQRVIRNNCLNANRCTTCG